MPGAKQIADLITVTRMLLGGLLVWLGLMQGTAGLSLACWLVIAAWTSDSLDGPIARHSQVYYHTWIGDHDLQIDMAFATALLFYMTTAGFVAPWLMALYLLVWTLTFWHYGVVRALGMLFQIPIWGWFVVVGVGVAPAAGWWLVAWILAAAVVTWPRLSQVMLPDFLLDMRYVWRQNHPGGHGSRLTNAQLLPPTPRSAPIH